MYRWTYWICSTAALLLLFFGARTGTVLTGDPDRGKVERDKNGTVRSHTFIWVGGGYHGGK